MIDFMFKQTAVLTLFIGWIVSSKDAREFIAAESSVRNVGVCAVALYALLLVFWAWTYRQRSESACRHLLQLAYMPAELPSVIPPYLSPMVLPPTGRRLAIERLRSYAVGDCLPKNRELVLGLAGGLENVGGPEIFDEKVMRSFMLFTNDLDITRGQSFPDTHLELL